MRKESNMTASNLISFSKLGEIVNEKCVSIMTNF